MAVTTVLLSSHAAVYNRWTDIHMKLNYVMIRYDSEYLMCSKKLMGSQLSPPHGTNKKLKCETKNKIMSVMQFLICFLLKVDLCYCMPCILH